MLKINDDEKNIGFVEVVKEDESILLTVSYNERFSHDQALEFCQLYIDLYNLY